MDTAVARVTGDISGALAASTRTMEATSKSINLPTGTKERITERNRVRRLALRMRDPTLKRRMNLLNRQIRQDKQELYNKQWQQRLEGIAGTGTRRKVPPLRVDGVTVLEPTVKAEVFADSLEQQFTLNPPAHASHDERIQRAIRTARERPDNDENAIPTIRTDEIRG